MCSLEVSLAVDIQFMGLLWISLFSVISPPFNTFYLPGASPSCSLVRNLTSCSSRHFPKLCVHSGPNGGRKKSSGNLLYAHKMVVLFIREGFHLSDCRILSGCHCHFCVTATPPPQYCLEAGARENEKETHIHTAKQNRPLLLVFPKP